MILLPLALALMTAAVLVVVSGQLMKDARAAPERAGFDRAVYRDQLAELERDRARGVIGDAEAETARLEIERRLLANDRADAQPARAPALPRLAVVLALVLAGGAGAAYLTLGAPGVPDLPFAERSAPARAATQAVELENRAADLEKEVKAKPDDADAWAQLGRTDANLSRWDQSAEAYRHATTLAPARTDLMAAYGEVLVMGADGVVTPAAQQIFAKLATQEPRNGFARYYLALADAQAGKTDRAIAAWQKLAAEAPENAPIRAELKRRIDAAAQAAGQTPPPLAASSVAAAAPAQPGPDAAQMADAAKLPPEQREAMVRGMVERLATRLESEPNDLQGWLRLGRAYGVLGERDKAADAFEHAATLDPKDATIPLQAVDALLSDQALEAPLSPRVLALLHKVEVLSPDEPEALWYLGLAAAQAKRPDEAARYWQRLLAALPPDAPERKTVTAALGALKPK